MSPTPGTKLGSYEIVSPLGAGGWAPILYEMATGKRAFQRDTGVQKLSAHLAAATLLLPKYPKTFPRKRLLT